MSIHSDWVEFVETMPNEIRFDEKMLLVARTSFLQGYTNCAQFFSESVKEEVPLDELFNTLADEITAEVNAHSEEVDRRFEESRNVLRDSGSKVRQ